MAKHRVISRAFLRRVERSRKAVCISKADGHGCLLLSARGNPGRRRSHLSPTAITVDTSSHSSGAKAWYTRLSRGAPGMGSEPGNDMQAEWNEYSVQFVRDGR